MISNMGGPSDRFTIIPVAVPTPIETAWNLATWLFDNDPGAHSVAVTGWTDAIEHYRITWGPKDLRPPSAERARLWDPPEETPVRNLYWNYWGNRKPTAYL